MIITDDHAHLDHHAFAQDKMDDLIKSQEEQGVKYIITQGVDRNSCEAALKLSKKYKTVLCALGLYPPDMLSREVESGEAEGFNLNSKEELLSKEKIDENLAWIEEHVDDIVAFGEVGLDFSGENPNKELQEYVFQKFIDLGEKYNLPLIIHSRKAEARVLEMLEATKNKKIVMHCFSGKKKLIQQAKEKKYYFSIPTSIVRTQHFQMMAEMIDMSRILTETDAPYLSPGRDEWPNKPSNVKQSIEKIAEIKKMTPEETSLAIFQNFQRLYL